MIKIWKCAVMKNITLLQKKWIKTWNKSLHVNMHGRELNLRIGILEIKFENQWYWQIILKRA